MNFRKHPKSLLAVAILAATGTHQAAFAQDGAEVEEIIVTGARGRPRTATDSPVPVDVFSAADIESISHTDTNNILQTLVPSFNVARQPISDGATMIRPAQLRGLPTDKTLVLVNGKRRHRAALVSIGGSGTQGPDLATIPAAAIKNVEVLRDGASAQYGSDAIAGVINFLLNDNSEGGSLTIDSGEFFEGDGAMTTVQGNIGLPLGDSGFVSISGEWVETDRTNRGEQYCQSWWCVDPNLPGFTQQSAAKQAAARDPAYQAGTKSANAAGISDVVQPWGQPQSDAVRVFVNAGYQLDADTEFYGYGNYSDSSTDGNFFYRYPGNGVIEQLREPDGSIYSPQELFPGGFTPQFDGDVSDFSLVGGMRGELDNGLTYDFSGRTGESEIRYTLFNTINPSLGNSLGNANTPTSFRPSDLINTETQFQADFTYEFDAGIAGPAVFAFGASYMDEEYELKAGDPASYVAGPYAVQDPWDLCNADGTPAPNGVNAIAGGSTLNCADSSDPVYRVVGVGSNGFPGNSPQFTNVFQRNSFALYGELSGDVTDALFMQGAVRYENYDDFDSEVLFQLAGRLVLTDNWNARASIGTGFRAPTPGQQGTVNVSTRLPDGIPIATGLFPAGGPVAQALGATPLKPEKSNNFTIGVTGNIGEMDLTVDYYRIDIDDRTNAISTRGVSTDPTSGSAYDNFLALDGAGVAGANTIGGVFYFTNAFDSRTEGFDVVASYPVADNTTISAALNYTENSFESDPSTYLNAENRYDFVNFDPQWRGIFTGMHTMGDIQLIARLQWYGESTNSNSGGTGPGGLRFQTLPDFYQFDLEGQWQINDMFELSAGARNLFDEYPDRDTISDYCCGRVYSSGTVVPWQGGYYYARLRADF
ncbi:MAG: TonB-dependent receptor [Pseudomonadales bacterium]|jgi:iron complex outermembrane receptor protein|nr:TonB-dependent receptor [Pseudomonadales bacterium]